MNRLKGLFKKYSLAHRVTIIYMVFGVLWILLSDQLLSLLISDIDVMAFIQTIKGNLYVLITGALLWTLIVMGLKEINALHEETVVSEAKYRSYFEQGFIGIVLLDESLQVVDANVKAQHIFGLTRHSAQAMDLDSIMPKDAEAIKRALTSQEDIGKTLEVTIKSQAGENTHSLLSLSKIVEEHGGIVRAQNLAAGGAAVMIRFPALVTSEPQRDAAMVDEEETPEQFEA